MDVPHLTPRTAAALLEFRTRRKCTPPTNVPTEVLPVVIGDAADLFIDNVFPRTSCLIQVDLAIHALRWTHMHFISLHAFEAAPVVSDNRNVVVRSLPSAEFLTRISCRSGRASCRSGRASWRSGPASAATRTTQTTRVSRLTQRISLLPHSTLHILYNDFRGITRSADLRMPTYKATVWAEALKFLLKAIPRVASAAQWRWVLSCMSQTSRLGATGFVHQADLRLVLRLANASVFISAAEALKDARPVDHAPGLMLPEWLQASHASGDHRGRVLNVQQVTGLLLRLSTASNEISDMYDQYTVDGDGGMGLAEWLAFVSAEQLTPHGANEGADPSAHVPSDDTGEAELIRAKEHFKHATAHGDNMCGEMRFGLQQFALQLLSPHNNASTCTRKTYEKGDTKLATFDMPLTQYFAPTSHNSYIVGDQLTGISTAEACTLRRDPEPKIFGLTSP